MKPLLFESAEVFQGASSTCLAADPAEPRSLSGPARSRLPFSSRADQAEGGRRYVPQCGIGMPCDCGLPPVMSSSVTAAGWCGLPKVVRTAVGWCGLPKVVRTAAVGAAAVSAPGAAATAPPARPNPARARAAMVVRTDMGCLPFAEGCGARRPIRRDYYS